MKRFISLLFFLCALFSSLPARSQSITFTPSDNSSTVVNGHTPGMTITSPAEGATDTLRTICGGGVCIKVISVSFALDSFALAANTEGDYPCQADTSCDTCIWKGDGQHIYVDIDHGHGRAIANINTPIDIPVDSTPGPHTIIAFLSRSWDESVKSPDSITTSRSTRFYCVRTFFVDTNTGALAVDTTKPLLTPNSPLDTNNYVYHPDSVLFDYYLMFQGLGTAYKVDVTIYDSTMTIVGHGELDYYKPYCIGGLQQAPPGRLRKYFIRAKLVDGMGDPVSNGTGNFNDRLWAFWVKRR